MLIRILVISLCLSSQFVAQQTLLPLNREAGYKLERQIYISDSNVHTQVRPYLYSVQKQLEVDTSEAIPALFFNNYYQNYLENDKAFFVSPMIGGKGTLQLEDRGQILPSYSIGTYLEAKIGKKIGVSGMYRYAAEILPSYIDKSIFTNGVLPSVARIDSVGNWKMAHQFEGYLSYKPNKYFDFLLGRGRNFWGDGYRSLMLSDNATPYPYLRINSTFWNVNYVNLYSWHNDFSTGNDRGKFSSSHLLSWNIIPEINLGIFETVVWQGSDTLQNRGFDIAYLNPAIFYRPVEYAQGSSDNSIMGLSLKVRAWKKHIFYGQLVLDEFLLDEVKSRSKWWANKQGGQLGYKTYDLFNITSLSFQTEFNVVRPFTYAHLSSLQNYGHNGQSLAHPAGANFWESVSFVRYQKERWYFEAEMDYYNWGGDTSSVAYGGNIFSSYVARDKDYGHIIGQGDSHHVLYSKLKCSYLLAEATNLRAYVQVAARNDKMSAKSKLTGFLEIGISSRLWNEYRDY